MKWRIALATLLALCGLCAARERSPIILERANNLSVSEVNGRRRQELHGNVCIRRDSLTVYCQNAFYYPDSGLVIFRLNVEFHDPQRVLFADEVTYHEFTEEVNAWGHVRIYQGDSLAITCRNARYYERLSHGYLYEDVRIREDNRRLLLTGKQGFVDHVKRYGRVTGNPVVTERDSALRIVTEVRADTVEYYGEDKRLQALGQVRIERDSLLARGTRLQYFTRERMAVLTGNPVAERGLDDARGDTLRMFFGADEKLSRVELAGRAVMTSPADSGYAYPRNRMEGKRMTLFYEDGRIAKLVVEGTATGLYHIRDKQEKRGINVTSGDRLTVFFQEGKMHRLQADGGTQGTYTPQSLVPDSLTNVSAAAVQPRN